MPIYEYKCEDCGVAFEELVFSKADQLAVVCKSCGSGNVAKLMSGAAVVAGGSGGGGEFKMPSGGGGGCCGGHCGGH
ncbi:MAG: zinc ribbon domain-containing protein [Candidatus Sumerlaeaceae bacterium]|nr:zinc ribbon domain-containing protein [Candidatus Sumerlaeaceae bacterium]